ncbi:phage major capsid protein [Gordonia sp. HY442]|uniref:phage major capsid protein n=1 Tax=Gordonia zhenghanii TaxID=2911516 RepID=UPI001F00BE84|nr:phage major capsid protein [Gordonia zhenghanii]MCF8607539.1 phage major capsid protein [Gordonia zhenghanii]
MAELTTNSAYAWSPDLVGIVPSDAIPEALILKTATVAGQIEGDAPSVRVPYVDDATATFIAEGATIPEADPALSECVVHTGKISQLLRLSREQFEQENASSLLSESVARAVTKAANAAYIAQVAPTSPAVTPPAGLLNIAGIEDGGDVDASLDALVDLLATLAENGASTEGQTIVVSPTAWAELRKMKTATGSNQSLIGAGTHDAERFLLDIPVLVDPAVPTGTGLVIDRTAVVAAVGPVYVAQSDQIYFASDSIGLRATWRFGANAVHADRLGRFTVNQVA